MKPPPTNQWTLCFLAEKVSDKQKEFEQNQNNNKADNKIMIDEDDYTSGHRQNGLQSPNDYNENRQQEAPILID